MQIPASDWSSVVEHTIESIPLVTTPLGSGSGVVVHESGLVLTNKHVIEHGDIARLKFRSGECVAQVLRVHDTADLALLKTHAPQPELQRPLPFREEQAKLGEPVLALGHPNRHLETVNAGIVSGRPSISLIRLRSQILRLHHFERPTIRLPPSTRSARP